ncbi:MAG: hypothetical protein IKW74_03055, partial [Thermoguttaceae bacterium]|nr:hypothetical protein [Thermoguttaceae bacterium]
MLSLVLYWLALPPVNCCWLAFSMPVCWVKIWKREESFSSWDYLLFWGISVGFWMSEIIWVSYPHAATLLGWL